jgi:hypothetical protein
MKRMFVLVMLLAVVVSLMSVAAPASASTLWYGGDYDQNAGFALHSFKNTPFNTSWAVYDDFNVASKSTITDIFASLVYFDKLAVCSQAYWEVRSGVSVGNGGSLVASGINTETLTELGIGSSYRYVSLSVDVPDFTLDTGTYWLSIQPIQTSTATNGGAYIGTTIGTNGIGSPLHNGNSYINNPTYYGKSFVSISSDLGPAIYRDSKYDFTYGVNIADPVQAVPEPATLLGFGLPMLMVGLGKLRGLRKH